MGTQVILGCLATVGITELLWLFYKGVKYSDLGSDIQLKEGEKEAFCFSVGIISAILVFTIINPHSQSEIVKKMVSTQYNNCSETLGQNDEPLTSDQCHYFQNVLNGKYSENYGGDFDILKYLGEER